MMYSIGILMVLFSSFLLHGMAKAGALNTDHKDDIIIVSFIFVLGIAFII